MYGSRPRRCGGDFFLASWCLCCFDLSGHRTSQCTRRFTGLDPSTFVCNLRAGFVQQFHSEKMYHTDTASVLEFVVVSVHLTDCYLQPFASKGRCGQLCGSILPYWKQTERCCIRAQPRSWHVVVDGHCHRCRGTDSDGELGRVYYLSRNEGGE